MSTVNQKSLLSINLWYEKYGNKTRGQLKAFRNLGFQTHVATIVLENNNLFLTVYNLTDDNSEIMCKQAISGYREAFKMLSDFISNKKYSFIYIRRLMSKLLYAGIYFKKISKTCPIVYEIPTYPLDTGNGLLYSLRDKIEMFSYNIFSKHVRLTLANVIDDVKLKKGWQIFHNAIDMEGYNITSIPDVNETIHFIIIANISEYHHYDRILDSMHSYIQKNKYNVHLSVISPESNAYSEFKAKADKLNLTEYISFYGQKTSAEIRSIVSNCHIGIGQLSTSEKKSNIVNTLKSKDYCAMGIPFVSTCYDTSFEKDFPYMYVTDSMDEAIDLDSVIEWYLSIYNDKSYKEKMYYYAKENLQYDKFALQIINSLNL